MLIAGAIVLLLATAAGGYAYWMHRRGQELAAVVTSTCGHVRQLADAANVSGTPSAFRQRCELVGVARPAHVGTVRAPLTGREAVWYRMKVTHEYYDYDWEERGGRRVRERRRKSRVLKDERSDVPFAIDDGTGQAVVYPDGAAIDEPVEVLDEMDRDAHKREGLTDIVRDIASHVDESIGYRSEEWIIPVDQKLFVQGEVTDEGGTLFLRRPEKGSFQVSTRSEADLVKETGAGRKWGGVAAAVLAVVGLVLVVLGAAV